MSLHQSTTSRFPDARPFSGFVETTAHALRLVHAARQGVIPRITRRLNDAERRSMIKSGAVFVFDVEESGIKRWTEGLLWSPSRIVGNFLVYREITARSTSRKGPHHKAFTSASGPLSGAGVHSIIENSQRTSFGHIGLSHEDFLSGEGTLKRNGMMKKTITVTIDGSDLHLIAYYTQADVHSGQLKGPSSRADIMALDLPPRLFRNTNFRNPPKVETGPDGNLQFTSETDDFDHLEFSSKGSDLPTTIDNHVGRVSPPPRLAPINCAPDSPTGSPIYGDGYFQASRDRQVLPRYEATQMPTSPRSDQYDSFWPVGPPQHSQMHHSYSDTERIGRPEVGSQSPQSNSWSSWPSQSYAGEISPAPTSGLIVHRSHLQRNYAPPNSAIVTHKPIPTPVLTSQESAYVTHHIPAGSDVTSPASPRSNWSFSPTSPSTSESSQWRSDNPYRYAEFPASSFTNESTGCSNHYSSAGSTWSSRDDRGTEQPQGPQTIFSPGGDYSYSLEGPPSTMGSGSVSGYTRQDEQFSPPAEEYR